MSNRDPSLAPTAESVAHLLNSADFRQRIEAEEQRLRENNLQWRIKVDLPNTDEDEIQESQSKRRRTHGPKRTPLG